MITSFEERKIGNTTFLVFANGMVPADDVLEMRISGDGDMSIRLRAGGWLVLHPYPSRQAGPV